MKGLFIKDWKLLKTQKIFLVMIFAIGIFLSVSRLLDFTFVLVYMTFISHIFVISSLSYDEYQNGYQFLFTLPITRKDYVKEKYCFGFFTTFLFWICVTLLTLFVETSHQVELVYIDYFALCFIILLASLIFVSFLLPIQFHFGKSSGNIAMVICTCLLLLILILGVRFSLFNGFSFFNDIVSRIGLLGLSGCLCILTLLIIQISYHRSLRLMRRKEL